MIRKMIRMRELAERLGIHRVTLARWARDGKFPAPVKTGAHGVAFYEDEIADWQKEKEAVSWKRRSQSQA